MNDYLELSSILKKYVCANYDVYQLHAIFSMNTFHIHLLCLILGTYTNIYKLRFFFKMFSLHRLLAENSLQPLSHKVEQMSPN